MRAQNHQTGWIIRFKGIERLVGDGTLTEDGPINGRYSVAIFDATGKQIATGQGTFSGRPHHPLIRERLPSSHRRQHWPLCAARVTLLPA